MRPIFHAELVNRSFGDPGIYIDLKFERRAILFDIGDITVLPTRKLLRISDVFVSHTHMDHFCGFDHMLRVCLGRDTGVRMYGPPGFIAQLEHKLAAYTWNLVDNYATDFVVVAHELVAAVSSSRGSVPASSSRGCSGPTLLSSERGMAQSSLQSPSSWVFMHSHRVCMPGGVKTVGGEREGGTYEGRTGMRKIVRGDSHMGSLSHRTLLSHRGLSSSRVSGGWNRAPFDGRASSLSGGLLNGSDKLHVTT